MSRRGYSNVRDKNTYLILKRAKESSITSGDAKFMCGYINIQHASRKLRRLYTWGKLSRRRLPTRVGGVKYLYNITKEGEKYLEWYEKV
mgnify:CR=1 FL=1